MRDKRDALMADIRDQMIVGAKRFGLEVIDVRIKRADLPAENSEAVFRRMQTERQQRAASYRAQGSQQSQQIKAEADRKVTVITRRRLSSSPTKFVARATASATASSPRPMARTQIFSASIARCRPMRTASPTGGRGPLSARSPTSSDISRRRTPAPETLRAAPTATPRPQRRRTDMGDVGPTIQLILAIKTLLTYRLDVAAQTQGASRPRSHV